MTNKSSKLVASLILLGGFALTSMGSLPSQPSQIKSIGNLSKYITQINYEISEAVIPRRMYFKPEETTQKV